MAKKMDPKLVSEKQKYEIKRIATMYGISQKIVLECKHEEGNTRSMKEVYEKLQSLGYFPKKKAKKKKVR